jgi:hypothetical protein
VRSFSIKNVSKNSNTSIVDKLTTEARHYKLKTKKPQTKHNIKTIINLAKEEVNNMK